MTAEQIAEWLAAGHSAAQIAELAGVHLRTAYKLIARHKPPPAALAVPPDFDRVAALNAAIDRAIVALGSEGPAAAERLLKLARSAKLLGLAHRGPPVERDREAVRDALALKLEQAASEPPPHPAPAAPPPPAPLAAAPPPPAPPEENPWLATLTVPRKPHQPPGNNPDYHDARGRPQGPVAKAPAEPPTPTSLITKPLSR